MATLRRKRLINLVIKLVNEVNNERLHDALYEINNDNLEKMIETSRENGPINTQTVSEALATGITMGKYDMMMEILTGLETSVTPMDSDHTPKIEKSSIFSQAIKEKINALNDTGTGEIAAGQETIHKAFKSLLEKITKIENGEPVSKETYTSFVDSLIKIPGSSSNGEDTIMNDLLYTAFQHAQAMVIKLYDVISALRETKFSDLRVVERDILNAITTLDELIPKEVIGILRTHSDTNMSDAVIKKLSFADLTKNINIKNKKSE